MANALPIGNEAIGSAAFAILGIGGLVPAKMRVPSGGRPALDDDSYHPTGPNGVASRQPIWDAMKTANHLSPNQLNKLIKTGNAPTGLDRVDVGKIKGEQTHVHLSNGAALNMDGTWKHLPTGSKPLLTKQQSEFLKANGWRLPR
jgi:hypothetical protein